VKSDRVFALLKLRVPDFCLFLFGVLVLEHRPSVMLSTTELKPSLCLASESSIRTIQSFLFVKYSYTKEL
jgi:hypothetical protein